MKFTCSRVELTSALSNVSRAAANKSTIAVLDGVLLRAEKGTLTLCCFNLDLGIKKSIDAKVEEEGKVVVPLKFFDMVKKFSGDVVEIDCSERYEIKMSCSTAAYALIGMNPDDFPELPEIENDTELSIPQDKMRRMISQTAHAINPANARPIYLGALFEIEKGECRMVTMDDFRIAVRKEIVDNSINCSFIVPHKTLSELNKIIDESEELVEIYIGKNGIAFVANGYTLTSRLLIGKFMPYMQGFERPHTHCVKVKTGEILAAVERISLVTNETHKSPVTCVFNKGRVSFNCSTAIGSAGDVCNFTSEKEVQIEIGLNGRLMVDAFRAADTDEVRILMGSPNEPVRIFPSEGMDFMFLLMPVRLRAPGSVAKFD